MPKVKTRKTAAKRFKITAKGTLLRRRAYRTHKLIAKGGARNVCTRKSMLLKQQT